MTVTAPERDDEASIRSDGSQPPELAADERNDDEVYRVKLDVFEGPLDLLLHLIRKHELDILDIPVGFITEKYLEYLDLFRELYIDVASEYLVMAATLTHIKSKLLLPQNPADDGEGDGELFDESDPRADLVRRLLEYQKYKDAALQLGGRPALGRDVFPRGLRDVVAEGQPELAPVSVFKLFEAFERVLTRANQVADHEVLFEKVSITERIVELTELLSEKRRMTFEQLFGLGRDKEVTPSRMELVVTFLALLEMCKMRVARITQPDPLGELVVELAAKHLGDSASPAAAHDVPSSRGVSPSDGEPAPPAPQADNEGDAW
jgi:segregation and condensation protein A